jgi:UDP-N-acetylmuramoyl-L-alanyl-D-glutamate--2,6-diaminopimelate ligase
MPKKKLADLFANVPPISPIPDVLVTGIAIDSRLVEPGDVFFAVVEGVDRYRFIDQVVARGAVAVVGERPSIEQDIPYVQVADDRQAMAHVSATFYGYPSRKLTMIGVTGTDGKTTTINLIYHILKAAGLNAGLISTVNVVVGDQVMDTGLHVTTPEAMDAQHYLSQMVDGGSTHAVLEMTSHSLAQRRGAMVHEFDIAVVTNIQHEHLFYHGSFEEYRKAKARLFTGLSEPHRREKAIPPLAALNRDDDSYPFLAGLTQARQVSYGLHPEADLRAENIIDTPDGLAFTALGPGFKFPVACSMVGHYNVFNCLAAIAVAGVGLGLPQEAIQAGIKALQGVPGRMERIDMGQDFLAVVDFAHTPNSLKNALEAGRRITDGRIIAIFGSAGLRDKEKRRMMAETSARLADVTILTAEDPRTESLDDILAEMAAGAESQGGMEGDTFFRIPDRGEAIRFGVKHARAVDLVIALGKGHEQSMCFIETEYPWDDRTAMRAALAEHLEVDGPEMPYLPTQDE